MASNPNDEQKEAVMWPGYRKTWGWMVWGKSEESLGKSEEIFSILTKGGGCWQLQKMAVEALLGV